MTWLSSVTSVVVTIIGVALVPVYMQFNTIYEAHGAMTAAVTPPLVVTLLFAVFWRRFTSTAALCTLVGGMLAIGLSIIVPDVIWPFAHGVDAGEKGDGFLGGMSQFKFMRAFFGIVVCSVIGVVVTCFTKRSGNEKLKGLVWGTVSDAIHKYKGKPGDEFSHARALAAICVDTSAPGTELENPDDESSARISAKLAEQLQAAVGDLIFVSDQRWWFGGLRSTHARVSAITLEADSATIELDERAYGLVVSPKRREFPVLVERFY
jgi:SSS family solute:Na+ symporter